MDLSNNSFSGVFPSVVKRCGSLATLDIGNNQFSGRIPPWVGIDVPALKILRLGLNRFTSEIPLEISQLAELQLLNLANNNLTGLIPREFGKFSAMKNPIISSTGSQTDESNYRDRIDIISKGEEMVLQRTLQLMTGIDLSGNSLSQCIPEELSNLEGLQFLNLSRNYLLCGIPKNIGSLNVLESLDLSLMNCREPFL
ncbi:hypothetical protein PVAP13_6KG069400 [Panicum virgatum]|uniref:Uncharacterized protein n=1 Tax=Panicum virgatum TaxID=38727 RepID=A0A8T0R8S4_PANVG|nr:hypothetical protein PVAP13_6KG069400 [Panicum virgatum]